MMIGCKTKHKLLKTNEESYATKFSNIDTSSYKKTDTTKKTVETKKETTKKHTVELTFDLDTKKLSGDTAGLSKNDTTDFELNKLINKALRYSSSLKIKLEKSISDSEQKKESVQNGSKEESTNKKTSTGEGVGSKKSTENKTVVEVPKPTFWQSFFGTFKWVIVWAVICLGIIIWIRSATKK
jgi:hypothetical protein